MNCKKEKPNNCDETQEKKLSPTKCENLIYFWCSIDSETILTLVKNMKEISSELNNQEFSLGLANNTIPIRLSINSDGGNIRDALYAYDFISNQKRLVDTYICGSCFSAATFISLAGNRRFISPSSHVLIHQLSMESWGTFTQVQDDITNSSLLMRKAKDIYKNRTNMSTKIISSLLKRDLTLSAEECIKYGYCDEIKIIN